MFIPDLPSTIAAFEPDTARVARDEVVVTSGFWSKVRTTLGKIPFTEDAVAAFYCAADRQTPAYVRAVLLGALAYFVMPADVIPDVIAGLGFTDDATVLMTALAAIKGHLTPTHRSRARAFFAGADPLET